MTSGTANNPTVETGVDSLLSLLKETKKISLEVAAKKLGIKQEIIQTWVDFLVEEMIIGIEYHFTKPYIYLNDNKSKQNKAKSLEEARELYYKELKKSGINEEQAEYYWKNELLNKANEKKDYFIKVVTQKNLNNKDFLWEKFLNRLIS